MYVNLAGNVGDLGLSLKMPDWLKNIVGGVAKQTRITVQTPVGPVTIDPTNKDQVAQLKKMLSTAQVNIGPAAPQPTAFERAAHATTSFVEQIPGGWLTLGGLAVAAVLVLPRLGQRPPRGARTLGRWSW